MMFLRKGLGMTLDFLAPLFSAVANPWIQENRHFVELLFSSPDGIWVSHLAWSKIECHIRENIAALHKRSRKVQFYGAYLGYLLINLAPFTLIS